MEYQGPERRKHRVMVTTNTEYHLRGDECVAVRDPKTGQWQSGHTAVGQKVLAGLIFLPSGSLKVSFGNADVGQKICFANDIVTSPVVSINRPSRDTALVYPQPTSG
jgi:hypothetical protein